MCSDAFNSFQLHSNNFSRKQHSTTVKKVHYWSIKLFEKLKNIICIVTHFLVITPCLGNFLLMSLYIYSNIIIMVVDYYSSLTYDQVPGFYIVNCQLVSAYSLKREHLHKHWFTWLQN